MRDLLPLSGWVLVIVVGAIVSSRECMGQALGERESPTHLIESVAQIASKPTTFSCGSEVRYAEVSRRLSVWGSKALPDLERALADVEANGFSSPYSDAAGWLVYAYAKIRAKESLKRLRQLRSTIPQFEVAADNAIAASLGLSGYISSTRPKVAEINCFAPAGPTLTINQFLLGWQSGDLELLRGSMGATAIQGLETLLAARSWPLLRSDYGIARPLVDTAVGYRVAEPGGEGADPSADKGASSAAPGDGPEPPVYRFVTLELFGKSGEACGEVRMLLRPSSDFPQRSALAYLVDNPDLTALLTRVSQCAVGP